MGRKNPAEEEHHCLCRIVFN